MNQTKSKKKRNYQDTKKKHLTKETIIARQILWKNARGEGKRKKK